MAFILLAAPPPPPLTFAGFAPSSTSSRSSLAVTLNTFSGLRKASLGLHPISLGGAQRHFHSVFKERNTLIVKVSSDINGTGSGGGEPTSESEEEVVLVENLPLESKLQLKLEQKMRMKLAKKIRLRRKKLVHKRRLRKKGRWPPSKMKKNKNV